MTATTVIEVTYDGGKEGEGRRKRGLKYREREREVKYLLSFMGMLYGEEGKKGEKKERGRKTDG